MNPAAIAAAGKARVLILWFGLASLFGLHLSIGQRAIAITALAAAIAVEIALDGHRPWPRKATPNRT